MTAAIRTYGLCRDYGPVRAVVSLDLVVEPGQVFAFLGPNGAGKTTTIRMLLALQRQTIWSAHELDEVQRLADRVAIIRQGRLIATETVETLRASTPQTVRARFAGPVDPALFTGIGGVSVTSCAGAVVQLRVTGAIGPVLRAVADHDPVDFTAQHADLDELFLAYYREPAAAEPSHAS
jgi:ABC-type multidrug transport system ATPase subunit